MKIYNILGCSIIFISKSGVCSTIFTRKIDYYLYITKFNRNNNNCFYLIYTNKKIHDNEITIQVFIVYIKEPSYNANIKLKIKCSNELLIFIFSINFQDFSFIKNIDIEINQTIMNINLLQLFIIINLNIIKP